MQKNKSTKTAIAAIVVVMGLATLQTMSMLSVQSAAAQPPFNQGQCKKVLQEFGFTKEEAHEICTDEFVILNQGQCIQFARDHPEFGITEELCKDIFSPRV
jgi:hypothetical protein